ncbi:MAG: trypsin-like peptidase domain-containing protein [Patescibacteria group bacterium]
MKDEQKEQFEKPWKYLIGAPVRFVFALAKIGVWPVIFLILVGLIGFSSYSAITANKRLALIETALGGPDRLHCTRQETIDKARPSIVRIIGGAAEGSGFVFKEGIIITNYHVIADEPSPKIVYADNAFENGVVFAVDPESDLALIKVQRENVPLLKWSDNLPLSGEEVIAMGFPLGGGLDGELTANATTIAGRRALDVDGNPTFIQLNGGLIGGMSGGPLLSRCGEVIGINEASMEAGSIGLAISSSHAQYITGLMLMTPSYLESAIARVTFEPDKSPVDAVKAYYNYLKARNFEEAYKLLSPNFIGTVSFELWRDGFSFSLDTTIFNISADKKYPGRVLVELGSTDLVDGQFVYKTFEGAWIVHKENGHYKLWESNIKETTY